MPDPVMVEIVLGGPGKPAVRAAEPFQWWPGVVAVVFLLCIAVTLGWWASDPGEE